jgi:hypothetical protein
MELTAPVVKRLPLPPHEEFEQMVFLAWTAFV